MEDYAKLRVVDLKAELKKRGLPQSGLKDALVERLRKADAQTVQASSVPVPSEDKSEKIARLQEPLKLNVSNGDVPTPADNVPSAPDTVTSDHIAITDPPISTVDASAQKPNHHLASSGPDDAGNKVHEMNSDAVPQEAVQDAKQGTTEDTPVNNMQDTALETPPATGANTVDQMEVDEAHRASVAAETDGPTGHDGGSASAIIDKPFGDEDTSMESMSHIPSESLAADRDVADEVMGAGHQHASTMAQKAKPMEPAELPSAQAPVQQPGLSSTSTSPDPEDAVTDARKRKRRSKSPAPSSEIMAQKRAKLDGASPRVQLERDDEPSRQDAQGQVAQLDEEAPDEPKDINPPGQEGDRMDVEETEHHMQKTGSFSGGDISPEKVGVDSEERINDGASPSAQPDQSKNSPPRSPSPSRPSNITPKATRYKDLFPRSHGSAEKPSRRSPSPAQENDDRDVAPALHPATSALYIRELMRPLHPPTLKDHLIALATPPRSSPDPGIVKDFFLDQIRTHCFVVFASVAAASRVRSALHNAVWPEERSRKPLWADFIPEEKVLQWVQMEQDNASSGSTRTAYAKRWEVVYEKVDPENGEDSIQATLREVGLNGPATNLGPGRGVQGAPLGPRRREPERGGLRQPQLPAPAPASRSTGSGFVALDSLFRSTVAKPKLYFLPVSRALADRRLDRLERLTSRGGPRTRYAGPGVDEMRRYTFEDGDLLVDRGPDQPTETRGYHAPQRYGGTHRQYDRGNGRERTWRERRDQW